MSRNYKNVRPKTNRVYSVQEVLNLCAKAGQPICRNTLSNWVSNGLTPSDAKRPQLFSGAELARFFAERKARTKKDLQQGEFLCLSCKLAVFPDISTIEFLTDNPLSNQMFGSCPYCGARTSKILGETEYNSVRNCLNTNTSLASIDEGKARQPSRIGTKRAFEGVLWTGVNDRIIHRWQSHAGRYAIKTTGAHLMSIRYFDVWFEGKDFRKLTVKAVAGFREHLKELGSRTDGSGLSKSTILHRASHMKSFFEWLLKNKGFQRLEKLLPDTMEMPKGMSAPLHQPDPKPFPSIEQATRMLENMDTSSRVKRRDSAIFALAFGSGLRSSALISLRIKHVLLEAKKVIQDARVVRAKNGKSMEVNWFPVPGIFLDIVHAWIDELRELGFSDEDALFPSIDHLEKPRSPLTSPRETIEPMSTDDSVRRAFKAARLHEDNYFTPHSARHCLKALGDRICSTARDRKIWSQNMGHENESTTNNNYAKPTQEESAQFFATIKDDVSIIENDNDLMLDLVQNFLVRGTPEFEKAERCLQERSMAKEEALKRRQGIEVSDV